MMFLLTVAVLAQRAWADRAANILGNMTLSEKIDLTHGHFAAGLYTGNTPANERLGIPSIKLNDGPQGFRKSLGLLPINLINASSQTAFPTGVTVAATWDVNLAFEWGSALGEEFAGKGANVQLGPGMNIARVPECGRNFEVRATTRCLSTQRPAQHSIDASHSTALSRLPLLALLLALALACMVWPQYLGEDPFLAGALVGPTVRGIQQHGVVANAKHFVANNQEESRRSVNVNVDRRTLFEVYYPAFRAAVEAGVGSVMCSQVCVCVICWP